MDIESAPKRNEYQTLVEFQCLKSHLPRKKKIESAFLLFTYKFTYWPLPLVCDFTWCPLSFFSRPPLPSNYCTVPNSIACLPPNTFI